MSRFGFPGRPLGHFSSSLTGFRRICSLIGFKRRIFTFSLTGFKRRVFRNLFSAGLKGHPKFKVAALEGSEVARADIYALEPEPSRSFQEFSEGLSTTQTRFWAFLQVRSVRESCQPRVLAHFLPAGFSLAWPTEVPQADVQVEPSMTALSSA